MWEGFSNDRRLSLLRNKKTPTCVLVVSSVRPHSIIMHFNFSLRSISTMKSNMRTSLSSSWPSNPSSQQVPSVGAASKAPPDTNAINGVPSRVLVLGDSGVGKSLLMCQLCTLLNQGRADAPVAQLEPTIGYRVEAIAMKKRSPPGVTLAPSPSAAASSSSHLHMVELIELGGNRSLVMGSGSRFQPVVSGGGSGTVDAIIFVYDEGNASSAISVATWYRESESAGIVRGCNRIALVGVNHNNASSSSSASSLQMQGDGIYDVECGASPRQSPYSPRTSGPAPSLASILAALYNDPLQAQKMLLDSSKRTTAASLPRLLIAEAIRGFLFLEHMFLYACSCLLFGLSQTQVDLRPLSVKESLATVTHDPKCSSSVTGLSLGSSHEAFTSSIDELLHFLSIA